MDKPEVIDRPYQIICEGKDDHALFRRLIRDHNLDMCQVSCDRGRDTFAKRIEYIKNLSTVEIKGYLIIADNDDEPEGRFRDVCSHLRRHHLPVPGAPFEIATSQNGVKAAIIMIPATGIEGGLESLLLACCDGPNEFTPCIDQFTTCVRTPRRKIDQDKLRLRAFIAASMEDDPSISLVFWLGKDNRPFQMDHPALRPIVDFIGTFSRD